MARIRDDKTIFFTRFTWEEIEKIHEAIQKSYDDDNSDIEDYFYDGGLPNNILQRLTSFQVELLAIEQPEHFIDTAHILARGY